ncbi:hypothetical protein CBP36_21025 (plasmid) [Acidovorax carolinensis]|uniref:Uncharacterized protein n=1 Tax=Acidovorax carolinensis TaxID=553814 RepID=A0A240UK51_9BURK|nr:hypothetical protein [Acidovorax carolinensis]ART61453.1 hypothetical protein CBP36_21025 [Acidovorax carolinensis]
MTKMSKGRRVADATRTQRAKTYLQRLEESGGKRVVTDFNAMGYGALQELLAANYGETQRDVVIRAVVEAAIKHINDSGTSRLADALKAWETGPGPN